MHSDVAVTGPALEILARHWDGPLMAYAETGRFEPPNWVFEDLVTPSEYADIARGWVDAGVQVVGGCCGTTPEHIAAVRAALG
jgi:homocysteine S-methyltransferase